jgi:hypothetical protein
VKKRMAWTTVLIGTLLVFAPILGVAEDQTPSESQNAISANLVPTLLGIFGDSVSIGLNYKRVIAEHFVLSVSPSVSIPLNGSAPMIALGVEGDWHPFDKGLNGLYVGLLADPAYWLPPTSDYGLDVGPTLGYLFQLPMSFIIEVSVAAGYRFRGPAIKGNTGFTLIMAEIGLGVRF